MADHPNIPMVEVAVAVVTRGDRVLAVLNPHWSAFTLPMTKRRVWQDAKIPPAHREEDWAFAAARAAAEWLGKTSTGLTPLPAVFPPFHQSDRTGEWKRYQFQAFQLSLEPQEEPRSDVVSEWLTVDEFLDENRRPISPTARHILAALREGGHLA